MIKMITENDMVKKVSQGCDGQSILDDYVSILHQMSYPAQNIYYAVMGIVSTNKYIHVSEMVGFNTTVGCSDIISQQKRIDRMCEAYLRGKIL